ncbi:hydrolase [Rickettsiella endosymbiont of Rhagonycha lignosa]|uniref:hydrolase n=1 Tax=Rickettsiella endosymbiont of Rhagonycha lignosa TaxID=3077937 RepID=UPI00313DB964
MLKLDPIRSALVLIDLQEGILPFAGGPHSAKQVLERAATLAQRFRAASALVFLVRVGWSADFAEAPKQLVDSPRSGPLPDNWWNIPLTLKAQDSDIRIIKRQWGAFYGTDLEMQLRRRGIQTIVLGGISTNIGVESTARNAWELGFELVLVEDICSAQNKVQHDGSFQHIFPRIGRVCSSAEILIPG